MSNIKCAAIFFLIISSVISAQVKKEIIGYFPEWAAGHQKYFIKHIETTGSADKLTIINYAFAVPRPDSSGKIVPHLMNPYYDYQQVYSSDMSVDGAADDSTQALRGHFNQIRKLKARHPQLKFVISIGGWEGSAYFSDAALTPESREIFVNSCIDIFIKGNLPVSGNAGGSGIAAGIFDGIDIDWEFPVSGGLEGNHNNINDRDNLTALFALFRKKLDDINPELILSAAIPAGEKNLAGFNVVKDQQYLNWYLLMTYDYSGSWDTRTAHHSNLFSNPDPQDPARNSSLDKSVRLLVDDYKVSSDKILAGAAFYGRGWIKVDSLNNGLFQDGEVSPGEFEPGFNNYGHLMQVSRNYNYVWDEVAMAPSFYNSRDKIFWTFDDPQSIALKCRYADANKLRGVFFWEISGDDINGTLVNTIFSRNMPDIVTGEQPEAKAPEIKIILPANSEVLYEGSDILLKVESNNTTKKVEYFCDNVSLGYNTKPPFNWVWFNIPKGKHIIKAAATNINGKTIKKSVKVLVKKK